MECRRSPRTLHTPPASPILGLMIAVTVWIGCSWSAVAVAETKGLVRRDLGLSPTYAAARSWCEVRLPSDPMPEHDAIRAASAAPRPCFTTASYGGAAADTLQTPLLAAGDGLGTNCEASDQRLESPLQLAGDGSSLSGDATSRLGALVADIRGSTAATATSGDVLVESNTIAAMASTSASRTEPALWALGAIAICGLGVAGLSAPWLATRLTSARRGWKP